MRIVRIVFAAVVLAALSIDVLHAQQPVASVVLHNASATTTDGALLPSAPYSSVVVQLTGTWVGTVTFQSSNDNVNWDNVSCTNRLSKAESATATAVGTYVCPGGANLFRAPFTRTSGTITAIANGTVAVHASASGGGGGGGVTTDIQDGAGDSVMDAVNNAVRVNIIAGAGSGGTSMTDDAAFTPGTTSVTPAGAMFDDVTPDSVNEGDGGVLRMSANRNLYTTLRDAAGNERGVNVDATGKSGSVPFARVSPLERVRLILARQKTQHIPRAIRALQRSQSAPTLRQVQRGPMATTRH